MKKVCIAILLISSLMLCSCGGKSKYDRDLESGINKMKSGQKMTESEKKATNDFLDWQSKQ